MSAYFCGLDVHRDSTYATILDCDGRIIGQRRIVNGRVLAYLSGYRISRVGIEASNQIAPLYRQPKRKATMYRSLTPRRLGTSQRLR